MLILAAVTAVIASNFLFRSAQEAKLATRSFFQSAALNLAEAGVEEGIFTVNTNGFTGANGWALATGSSTDYVKSIATGLDFQQATGSIHVRVDAAASNSPIITAAGLIAIPNQPAILKQIRVGSAAPMRLWSNTIVSKGNVTFSGSAAIDSYDSSLGPWNPATNRSDHATVATNATVQVTGNAEIYGYVATNGTTPQVGGSGRIYGATSPASPNVDASRVRADFNANLSEPTVPAVTMIALGSYALGTSSVVVLPRLGDAVSENGRYVYSATDISLTGSSTLMIDGAVDIIVSGPFSVGGTSQLTVGGGVALNPSLNLYCSGDVSMGGNGMVNSTTKPSSLCIWGTKVGETPQTVALGGSSDFIGTIYAPNANITTSGSADVFGAMIGKTVTLGSGTAFHYDVQLEQTTTSAGPTPLAGTGNGYLRVRSWSELKAPPGASVPFARDNRQPFTSLF
ncbi:MAG: hypothetical protein WC718_17370 [Phycisphaerales bacterium]